MNTIFVRSPFFITVDEIDQIGSKVELYIWNNPDTIPLLPTYTLSKKIASPTQTANNYNISGYCREYISHLFPEYDGETPKREDYQTYCNVTVKTYFEESRGKYEPVGITEYIAVEGYTNYLNGYNQTTDADVVIMFNPDITLNLQTGQQSYVNALLNIGDYTWIPNNFLGTEYTINITDFPKVFKLPLFYNPDAPFNQLLWGENFTDVLLNEICEAKYTPVLCSFVNRFGGWSFINFFKAQANSIDVKGVDYNVFSEVLNYDFHEGQSKSFNVNGTQKVKLNTGWVAENYSELIQDLLLSETVLLDNKPVKVMTKSTNLKTSLRDKNINYEMDFEYAYNLINNAI
jgi:hypothetical protein